MEKFMMSWFKKKMSARFILALLVVTAVMPGLASGQIDNQTPPVGEGCLLYHSPVSGRYEHVPLLHTDAVIDVPAW
jgi:hypothetical protein